jgi:protein-disulfide isomerase
VNMARAKGTPDRLEEWLFANQGPPLLTPQQVRDAARTVGGISDFDAQYPQVLKDVRADALLGEQLKVGSTPTFFINGRKVTDILAPQYFNVLIELELKN